MPESTSPSTPPKKPLSKAQKVCLLLGGFFVVLFLIAIVASGNRDKGQQQPDVGQQPQAPNQAPKPKSAPEPVADLKTQLARIVAERKRISAAFDKISADHPTFQINGVIKDRDEKSVVLRGRAFPSDNDQSRLGTLTQEGNILVLNPTKEGLANGATYLGEHYYLRKSEGTNALGGKVPVYVYGDEPKELTDLRKQYQASADRYVEIRRKRYAETAGNPKAKTLQDEDWQRINESLDKLASFKIGEAGLSSPRTVINALKPKLYQEKTAIHCIIPDQGVIFTFLGGNEIDKAFAVTLVLDPAMIADYFAIYHPSIGMKANTDVLDPATPIIEAKDIKEAGVKLKVTTQEPIDPWYNNKCPELWCVNIPQRETTPERWFQLTVLSDGASSHVVAATVMWASPAEFEKAGQGRPPFDLENVSKDPFETEGSEKSEK